MGVLVEMGRVRGSLVLVAGMLLVLALGLGRREHGDVRNARPRLLLPAEAPSSHWTLIPGIGRHTALEIDRVRRAGHFDDCAGEALSEKLLEVRGIGATTLARARPYLDLNACGTPGTGL